HASMVFANVAPTVLDRLLGEDTTRPEPEGAQLKINMLLSRLPALKDASVTPEQAFAGTFHINEAYTQLETAYEQAASGAIPARLSRADPEGARQEALRRTLASVDSVLAEPLTECLLDPTTLEVRTPVDIEASVGMPGGHIFHGDLQWPFAENPHDVGRWGV